MCVLCVFVVKSIALNHKDTKAPRTHKELNSRKRVSLKFWDKLKNINLKKEALLWMVTTLTIPQMAQEERGRYNYRETGLKQFGSSYLGKILKSALAKDAQKPYIISRPTGISPRVVF